MATKRKTTKKTNRRGKNRSRKLQSQGFLFPTRMAGFLALASVVSLSYLWICSDNEALANEIRTGGHELEQLRTRVGQEEARWTSMTSLENLRSALATHELSMAFPNPDQVVHVRDFGLWKDTGGRDLYGQLSQREAVPLP